MAGDTANVAVWSGADVFIGSLTAPTPVGGADFDLVGTDPWVPVGILDGSAGFAEAQTNDSTDFYGWGVGIIASTRKNLAIKRTFTPYEDNETVLGLRYDTDGITWAGNGEYSGVLGGRDLQDKFKVAFQVQTGDEIKRVVSKNFAQIDSLGDATEGEDALQAVAVTVRIYPTAAGEYWDTFKGAAT